MRAFRPRCVDTLAYLKRVGATTTRPYLPVFDHQNIVILYSTNADMWL